MNSTIWKFVLGPWASRVGMPRDARILHVHEQDGQVCIWAEVDPMAPTVERKVALRPTGGRADQTAVYVGTVHLVEAGRPIVLHVYDGGEA